MSESLIACLDRAETETACASLMALDAFAASGQTAPLLDTELALLAKLQEALRGK